MEGLSAGFSYSGTFGMGLTPFPHPEQHIRCIMDDSGIKLVEPRTCKECEEFDTYRTQGRTMSHWYRWGWCRRNSKSVFEDGICISS